MQGDLEAVTIQVSNDPFYPILLWVMSGEKYGGYSEAELVGQVLVGGTFHFYRQIIPPAHFRAADGDGVPGESIGSPFGYRGGGGEFKIRLAVFFPFHL